MIDFSYRRQKLETSSGCIFKGKNYRCFYVTCDSLYKSPVKGTERLQIYDFRPKGKIRASIMILHGLGTRNIEFLLWMGTHLASAGVNAVVPVLPGNFTRIEDGRLFGSQYLWPDYDIIHGAFEHAVVDVRTTIDYLEQEDRWRKNNCVMGYCLGGMLTTIVSAIDNRFNQKILMTTGGHMPEILFESSAGGFVRRLIEEGNVEDELLRDKDALYELYDSQLPLVEQMTLEEILGSEEINPLFKVDPLSYLHLLDKSKFTVIDAFFDRTLSITSRKSLYKKMKGAKRYVLPISHAGWLPFEFFLARYILHKVNIYDRETAGRILTREVIYDTFDEEADK